MNLLRILACLLTSISVFLLAENNHYGDDAHQVQTTAHDHSSHSHIQESSIAIKAVKWIGNFHPISVHFPIALIVMTAIAELLASRCPWPLFSHSSHFMIISAAVASIPTALLGLAYGYGAEYNGVLADIFWWHRFLGILTALLCISTAGLKQLSLKDAGKWIAYYQVFLTMTLCSVAATGYLGGEMTFGVNHLLP